jgi:hypothetical protein
LNAGTVGGCDTFRNAKAILLDQNENAATTKATTRAVTPKSEVSRRKSLCA